MSGLAFKFSERFVFVVLVLLVLASCQNNGGVFSLPEASETITEETAPAATSKANIAVVADQLSPKLNNFLSGKGFVVDNIPFISYAAKDIQVDGDYIVWSDNRNGNWDIFAYQVSTGSEINVVTNSSDQSSPVISGDIIVWEDGRNGALDIYGYKISTATEFKISDAANTQSSPQIDGDYVVWQDNRSGNDSDIYAYQISTGNEITVSTAAGEQWSPKISGDHIVWQTFDGTQSDVYGYQISSGTIIFNTAAAAGSQYKPEINGDYVVWVDNRNIPIDINNRDDIYAYKLSTSTEFAVTTEDGDQGSPQIDGDYIVWQDKQTGDFNIHLYQISTANEQVISSAAGDQTLPIISGDIVAWQDARNGNIDIYAYQISQTSEKQITSHVSNQQLPATNGSVIAWVDPERGVSDARFTTDLGTTLKEATQSWVTPSDVISDIAQYEVVIFGNNFPSLVIELAVFDAAINAGVNILGLGGHSDSLAEVLEDDSRYGIETVESLACSPMEIISVPQPVDDHPLFLGMDVTEILGLELTSALSMDELVIKTNTASLNSPSDWTSLATFSGNMCNAAQSAIVEFTAGNNAKVLLDGSATTADNYDYWSTTRWNLLVNELNYLLPAS